MTEKARIRTSDFATASLSVMSAMRADKELCDVVLSVDGTDVTVSAHRVVLAAASPYFRAMFSSGMLESRESVVRLADTEVGALRSLVDYAYTGEISVDDSNVDALFLAAHQFQFTEVVYCCEEILIYRIDPSNCISWAKTAQKYDCSLLRRIANRCVAYNVLSLAEIDDGLMALSFDDFANILAMDELVVDSEEQVIELVKKWVGKQAEPPANAEATLLQNCVRWPLLNLKLPSEETVKASSHNSEDVGDTEIPPYRSGSPAVLVAAGGSCHCKHHSDDHAVAYANSYSPIHDSWKAFPSLNHSRYALAVVNASGSLYAVGGLQFVGTSESFELRKLCNFVERYDSESKRWIDVSPMGVGRSGEFCVEMGGRIYACGNGKFDHAMSAESYDPQLDKWQFISAPELNSIVVEKMLHVDGMLHALAFQNLPGIVHLKYDPVVDKWVELLVRGDYGNFTSESFVTLGHSFFSFNCDGSVSQMDTRTGEWSEFGRHATMGMITMVGHDNKIYALNGSEFLWMDVRMKNWIASESPSVVADRSGAAPLDGINY